MDRSLMSLLIFPAIISGLIAYSVTPLVIKFANKLGIIDDPQKNKHPKVTHTHPVPRGGGLAVFVAILIVSLFFLPLDKHLVGILIGASLVLLMGILDDIYNLNPYLRIGIGIIAALVPIASGIGIAFITVPFIGLVDLSHPQISFNLLGETRTIWILSDFFALFWIVFLMNIVNMGAKGLPGQLSGVVSISAITIAILSLKFSADITEWPVIVIASIVAGAFIGFLPWNFYPQHIMPSYSGATLGGYFLALLSILTTAKVGTVLIVLGIPIVDIGYAVIRRVSQGKSPVWGDRGHLHHKLLDSGNFSRKQVVYLYWLFTAFLGALALNLNASYKLYTIVGVVIVTGGLFLILTYKPRNDKHNT